MNMHAASECVRQVNLSVWASVLDIIGKTMLGLMSIKGEKNILQHPNILVNKTLQNHLTSGRFSILREK